MSLKNILRFLKQNYIVFFFILILILLLQSINNPLYVFTEIAYLSQPYDLRGFAKAFIYSFSYLVSIVALVMILGIRSSFIFGILLSLFFIFYSIDFFIQFIGNEYGFNMQKYVLAVNEVNNYKYLLAYIDYIIYAVLFSLLIIFILIFIRKKYFKEKYNSLYALVILIPIFLSYEAPLRVSSIQWYSFPSYTKIPAIIIRYGLMDKFDFKERILSSNIQANQDKQIQNIVWIIDESITGSYLSINGYDKNTTPYLSSLEESTNIMSNYGIVNSVSNCSSPSNFYLRLGMNPRLSIDIQSDMLNLPTIYQYAKRAGYDTWLYDAQAAYGTVQNNLSIYDMKYIDNYETLERNILQKDRDDIIAKKIIKLLEKSKSKKKFIVFVKLGSHFPYVATYDSDEGTFFTPVLDSIYGGITLENKEKLINTYLNSLRHSTDLFLKNFINKVSLSNTIVFYTSDHGQNIMETDSKSLHCNQNNIPKNEVTVPLLVFSENANKNFPVNIEKKYSQVQIFSTTLSLMGFSNHVVKKYGTTLWDGLSKEEKRKYFITYTGKVVVYE